MIQPTELQSMRDTLQRLIFSGMRRRQFADRSVEYNTFGDVNRALRDAEAELSTLQTTVAAGFTLARHSRD